MILGIAFGLVVASSTVFITIAFSCGPMSYSILIATSSMLVCTALGAVLWKEYVTVLQIIGMLIMITALYITINPKKDKQINRKWLFSISIGFLCNCFLGLLQKYFQTSPFSRESGMFLNIALVAAAVFTFISYLFLVDKMKINNKKLISKSGIMLAIITGVFLLGTHIINLYLAGNLPSIIFYPVNSGGVLLLSTMSATIFFKEKISRKQCFGIILGAISIILI